MRPTGPVPTEPFGWFRKEINTVDDLKGLKYRTAGLAIDMMTELGASPVQLAPADIVPSLERGVIDAAEFANITDDRILGFPDVAKNYYLQSYLMCNNVFELSFNKTKHDALDPEVREHDPHLALDGGPDGLQPYRDLAPEIARILRPQGVFAVEIGWDQGEAVKALFEAAGFTDVKVVKDLGDRDRVVTNGPDPRVDPIPEA